MCIPCWEIPEPNGGFMLGNSFNYGCSTDVHGFSSIFDFQRVVHANPIPRSFFEVTPE
jgi:hypothetical protein